MSLVTIKLVQMIPGLRDDHGSSHLWGVFHPVYSASIQDVDAALGVNEDLGHSAIPGVHGDNQSVGREENGVGVCVREGDQPTRGRGWPIRTIRQAMLT